MLQPVRIGLGPGLMNRFVVKDVTRQLRVMWLLKKGPVCVVLLLTRVQNALLANVVKRLMLLVAMTWSLAISRLLTCKLVSDPWNGRILRRMLVFLT